MLINDSEDARVIFRTTLRRSGYHVIEAAEGFDGYSLAFKEVPDLVLIEHPAYVPGGTMLVDALGTNERTERVRFLVVTSRVVFDNDPWLLRKNCAGYLLKPIKPPILLTTVSRLIGPPKVLASAELPEPDPG
jgi:response regulator RpfG family c-di-GMP phosphodiesterase